MTEFSAAAELDVTLNEGSLSNVRREIESELGDVGVGGRSVAPDGGRPGGGVSRGQRAGILDASRKQLDVSETLVELDEERNDLLSELVDTAGGGGGGGLGAGGGFLAGRAIGGGAALGGAGTALSIGGPLALMALGLTQNDPGAASRGEQTPAGRFDMDIFDLLPFDLGDVEGPAGLGQDLELLREQEESGGSPRGPPVTSPDESGSGAEPGTDLEFAQFADEARGGIPGFEGSVSVNNRNDITVEVGDLSDVQRAIQNGIRELQRQINDIENQITGNRSGAAATRRIVRGNRVE